MSKKKNVPKSNKNVLNRVIGPVEFRKISYSVTWWHPAAREHDLMSKFQVFWCLNMFVNF